MRIKETKDKNQYIFAGGVWVRNFTEYAPQVSLNHLVQEKDYPLLLENERANKLKQHYQIAEERFRFTKVLIVSDGYDFAERHKALAGLPKDVAIFAVNRALAQWSFVGETNRKPINFYVVNNPYPECRSYFPTKHSYFPAVAASARTNANFLARYPGNVYLYEPVIEQNFGRNRHSKYHVDDYRNPICAAISLAYRFGVRKLGLFCCDDSFAVERPAAVKLQNGLWTYPQHLVSQEIIDANLYWLTHQPDFEVEAGNWSSGPDYANARYISCDTDLVRFFNNAEEEAKHVI